ncbi:hypothetical protein BHYA_0238g00020 [Botrytis hyacinthi]|uniref:Uncharacterized protein n=1 Tax=Botrytis hyacinthi TaxID=278943 RepID=A0A4Z1GI13_9HELO|nr:hypothetical protein BHYA_0238g00020 [Botrytis hyacinthi]
MYNHGNISTLYTSKRLFPIIGFFESGSNLTLSKLPSLSKSARDLRPSRILILISTSASTHLRAEAMAELVL